MMTRTLSIGTGLAAISLLGSLIPPNIASASTKGRKNTAIGLGAAAAYELLNHKTTNGLVLGAGAAYAYKKYKDEQRDNDRRHRVAQYRATHSYTTRTYRSSSAYGGASNLSHARYSRASTPSRLVFTGVISRDTDFVKRKLAVTSGGVERRIDVPKNVPIFQAGDSVSVHDLMKGDEVRVSAVRTGPDQWQATRIDVLNTFGVNSDVNRDDTYRYDTSGGDLSKRTDRSYSGDAAPASASNRYTGVGIVQSVNSDDRSFVIRVANNLRTVYTDDTRLQGVGSVTELRRGDRVRVVGDLDGRNVNADSVSLLD